MATALILHVIAISIVLNRFPLRWYTVFGFFLYFWAFYLGFGHYLKAHREVFTPLMPLEDDYWNYEKREGKSPFAEPKLRSSDEVREEEERNLEETQNRKRRFEEDKGIVYPRP